MEEKKMELKLNRQEQDTIRETEMWQPYEIFGIFPYLLMASLQVFFSVVEKNLVYICFAIYTLVTLSTYIFYKKELKHKQAVFNVVCSRLHKYITKERKHKEEE